MYLTTFSSIINKLYLGDQLFYNEKGNKTNKYMCMYDLCLYLYINILLFILG